MEQLNVLFCPKNSRATKHKESGVVLTAPDFIIMGAILRVLSKSSDGTTESKIIPINNIIDFSISVKESNPEAVDTTVTGEKFEENRLTVVRSDGSEVEFDASINEYQFEIRDEQGEILCDTDNLFKLEESFCSAMIESFPV